MSRIKKGVGFVVYTAALSPLDAVLLFLLSLANRTRSVKLNLNDELFLTSRFQLLCMLFKIKHFRTEVYNLFHIYLFDLAAKKNKKRKRQNSLI